MKTYIPKIISKPSDYWVCKKCNGLNWYENEKCTGENQGRECEGLKPLLNNSIEVEQKELKVLEWVDNKIEFYKDGWCNNCRCESYNCTFNKNDIEIYL